MSWLEKRKEHGTGGFDSTIPDGDYVVTCMSADLAENSAGTGRILKLRWQVTSQNSAGATLTDRLNVEHTNQTAERIGLETVNSIIQCSGMDDPESEQDFVGVEIGIRSVREESEEYGDKSVVSYYKEISSTYPEGESAPAVKKKPTTGAKPKPDKKLTPAAKPAPAKKTTTAKKPWEQ